MRNRMIRTGLVAGTALIGLAVSAGVVGASANNKAPGYTSHGESAAGIDIFGSIIEDGPTVVGIANTDSQSDTNKQDDGASSSSSAHALQVLGTDVGGSADCESQGTDNQGVDKDSDSGGPLEAEEALVIDLEVAQITVLSASCDSKATQSNNAGSSAEASVVTVDAGETQVVVLGSSSSNKTTSGQANSSSEFTVASVGDTTLLGCSSQSRTNKGGTDTSSSVTVVGTPADTDCPFATADSSHE